MISLLRHLYAVIGYLENIFRKNNYFLIFNNNDSVKFEADQSRLSR